MLSNAFVRSRQIRKWQGENNATTFVKFAYVSKAQAHTILTTIIFIVTLSHVKQY